MSGFFTSRRDVFPACPRSISTNPADFPFLVARNSPWGRAAFFRSPHPKLGKHQVVTTYGPIVFVPKAVAVLGELNEYMVDVGLWVVPEGERVQGVVEYVVLPVCDSLAELRSRTSGFVGALVNGRRSHHDRASGRYCLEMYGHYVGSREQWTIAFMALESIDRANLNEPAITCYGIDEMYRLDADLRAAEAGASVV
jgi:hypothetical protein